MGNIEKINYRMAGDSAKSDHRVGEQNPNKLLGTNFESQISPSGVRIASDPSIFDYEDKPSKKCSTVLTKGHAYEEGTDATVNDGKLPDIELSVPAVLNNFEETEEVDTPQLESEKSLFTAMGGGSFPKRCGGPGIGSSQVVDRGITGNLPGHTMDADPPTYCGDLNELSVASLSQNRSRPQLLNAETDNGGIDQEPNSPIQNEGKTCPGQEWKARGATQFSGTDCRAQRTERNENHINHISFKLPISKIPDTGSIGFSFGPKLEEISKSSRTQELLRPTLNPFEDIEKQGRFSPFNHPRSPPGSRHHSRSSSMGLQALRPFPAAMKISKATGDQPPEIPSPPLLSCSVEKFHESTEEVESLKQILAAEPDPLFDDGSCLECEIKTKEVLGLNNQTEPLDIKDFDILFSAEQKVKPYKNSSTKEKSRDSGTSDVKSASGKNLGGANRSDFSLLGAESTWMSPRINRGKAMVENQGKEAIPEAVPMDNDRTSLEAERH